MTALIRGNPVEGASCIAHSDAVAAMDFAARMSPWLHRCKVAYRIDPSKPLSIGDLQEEGIIIVTGGLVKVAYNEFQGTSQTYYIGVGGMFGIFSALTGARSAQWGLGNAQNP